MTDLLEIPLHRLDPSRAPVVLLGGLNLVRALGLAGLQAVVATSDDEEPALRSRHCTVSAKLPPTQRHDARVDAIASLGERLAGMYGRRVPLMYGSDDALELIYSHRERLGRYYLFLMCDPDVAESLIAKDRFQEFAESVGLPVPRALSWEGHGPGSLAACDREVVAKPRAKRDWHNSALCQRLFDGDGKAITFPNGAAALAHPVVRRYRDQLAFQEYIPGDDTCLWSYHAFADEHSEVIDAFVGRKVRTFPACMGESAFIELAEDASLAALGREVALKAGLRGPFKIDFKRDPRDGRWYALEVNARYTLWQYLGAANGVNLMRTAYDYLLNRVRTRHAPSGAQLRHRRRLRWLDLSLDRKAFRELHKRGELSFARWIASIAASRNLYNLFSWNDPHPFAHSIAHRVARKMRRGPGRVLHRIRTWASTAS